MWFTWVDEKNIAIFAVKKRFLVLEFKTPNIITQFTLITVHKLI